jgi:dipeptidyl aminopeptidase/acylaminoacyl peptidase
MKRILLAGLVARTAAAPVNAQEEMNIGKQNISVKDRRMSPEALWAMGRISAYAASPDGSKIVYQVGYYSVKQNKSHHVLYMMQADGSQQRLTTSSKNETDAAWLDTETIAFLTGGDLWTMKADGSQRRQLTQTGDVEGFKFAPDGSKVILLKSIPYTGSIKARPADLPKTTGRVVTDLMYRHWDHYVESILHPFVAEVTADGIVNPVDILEG